MRKDRLLLKLDAEDRDTFFALAEKSGESKSEVVLWAVREAIRATPESEASEYCRLSAKPAYNFLTRATDEEWSLCQKWAQLLGTTQTDAFRRAIRHLDAKIPAQLV